MCPSCNINTLKMIYFAYFHSVMEFGIIFWGAWVESKRIFLQQKRIIRIMTGSSTRTACKMLFPKLKILTLISRYILFLMRFLSSNLVLFTFNSSVHNINTRLRLKLWGWLPYRRSVGLEYRCYWWWRGWGTDWEVHSIDVYTSILVYV